MKIVDIINKILFKNDYFSSERLEDGSTIITILKDLNKFYGINLDNCKLITNAQGFIGDKFTHSTLKCIKAYCNSSKNEISKHELELELRNRALNMLISMI